MYDLRVKAELLCVGDFVALRFGLHFSNFVLPRFPGSRKTAQMQEESTEVYKRTVGSHLPSGVCVCVTLGVIGILLDLFSIIAGGLVVHASTSPTKRLALNTDIGGDAHRRTCYFHFPFSEMARG